MTPADKRVMDLLDRWLTSIELHLKYAQLDTTRYDQVQPWPAHERPARWILELAQQKVLQLKTLCKARLADQDPGFAESLELMCFLANLVGSQQVQRFIPLADPARENSDALNGNRAAAAALTPSVDTQAEAQQQALFIPAAIPAVAPAPPAATKRAETAALPSKARAAPPHDGVDTERTREMPRVKQANKRAPNSPGATRQTATTHDSTPRKTAAKTVTQAKPIEPAGAGSNQMNELVVADAVRLLRWGRQWHELVELIARMAERPGATEIRRILRSHKASIEAQLTN